MSFTHLIVSDTAKDLRCKILCPSLAVWVLTLKFSYFMLYVRDPPEGLMD